MPSRGHACESSGWWLAYLLAAAVLIQSAASKELSLDELVQRANKVRPQIIAQKVKHTAKLHRGIVIAAGGSDQLANALATVQVLRHNLSCQLHIEVIYYGEDEADVDLINKLKDLPAVKAIDASASHVPLFQWLPETKVGYLKKVLAIYCCSFTQMLYLDADNTPLQDPSKFFEWPEFKKHGNVFWPDYMGSGRYESVKEGIYTAFNVTAPWTVQADWKCSESGQFLFDRQKHTDVLEWTLFVNAHHETSYKYIYGDKDTFEFAFHLAGKAQQYRRIGYGPRASFKRVKEDGTVAHTGMLQTNSEGEPLFFHQVAGGKYHLDTKDLVVPEFASLGMTINGLNHMHWNGDLGTLIVKKEDRMEYKSVTCSSLDSQTANLLAKSEKKYKSCGKEAVSDGVPIPLIPLTAFPKYVIDIISSLASNFRILQLEWKEKGGQEM